MYMIQTVTMTDNRYQYNIAIVNRLKELVDKYPELRFNQLLIDCGVLSSEDSKVLSTGNTFIKDPFYEESEITWKRMCKNRMCFNEE